MNALRSLDAVLVHAKQPFLEAPVATDAVCGLEVKHVRMPPIAVVILTASQWT